MLGLLAGAPHGFLILLDPLEPDTGGVLGAEIRIITLSGDLVHFQGKQLYHFLFCLPSQ